MDIAIEKISAVKLEGFTDKENERIRKFHQLLLQIAKELCARNESVRYECGILIDLRTWEYAEIEGYEDGVNMAGNFAAKNLLRKSMTNSLLYMHNHPSTGTFSATDIKTFLRNRQLLVMTAVGNDGSVYCIQKTSKIDEFGFWSEYICQTEKYRKQGNTNEATLAIKSILKRARKYGLIYKKG